MTMLVTDPDVQEKLKAEREASGADQYDEVWEGVYMMAPLANDEHQELQFRIAALCQIAIGLDSSAKVRAGVNVSDREEGWQKNYRIPDVAIFLPNRV